MLFHIIDSCMNADNCSGQTVGMFADGTSCT